MQSSVPFFSVAKPFLVSPPVCVNCHLVTSTPSTTANDPIRWQLQVPSGPRRPQLCLSGEKVKEIDSDLSGFNCGLAHLFCPDDRPAHIKSSMFGCQLTIPISNWKLNMGMWQGIWLCEHCEDPTARKVVVTLNGI